MPISGLIRTYDQSYPRRESLEDIIAMISPTDTPLFSLLNREPIYNIKHEWLEDSLRGMRSSIRSAVTAGKTAITVAAGDGAAKFPVTTNYPIVARIDEELVLVTARTSDVLTVTRKYNAVTQGHSANSIIEIIADLSLEGADAPTAFAQAISRPYNYTQIFQETIFISGTQQAMNLAGIPGNEAEYQTQRRLEEMKIQLERSLISGYRAVGASSTVRTMGGLHMFISTNKTNASGTALTEPMIQADLKAVYDAGGKPNILLCNSTQAQKISNMYASRIRTDNPEKILGGAFVPRIIDPVGGSEIAIIVDRFVPQHEYYVLTGEKLALGVLREFRVEPLAKTGDADKSQVIGEYTLIVKNEAAHARRYNLSTS